MPSAKCYLLDEGRHPAKFAMKSCSCGIGYQSGMDAVLSRTKDNEDDQPPFVDSESEDEETRRWRRMRIYHKKRYEYSSLNHNLHFETTADSRGEEATLTVVEEVAVEEAMTEVIDEVLEEMTEVE
ncbi:hypothetical protein CAPTEDRAFT_191035 [Capitella teleta]|uniref:Uncharacterized protein n=1 Tax=Capitella teleta TaxID=283909 RepID=R7UE80_CAPTE|nr:hypothetical protein CAPTEDRAFT_188200 [Capitella teleta]ELU10670.1 hypothetical protein CAPTEDRAFT_191034 [Capitella teleta]ELU10671.1 hypothetical protein CAPTEDRAFT_191035 [Capitella teleta]|eukprot:ELU01567.1 hypothetical protein CAPTEDRAFT_188200 [Capitella teleta]